MLDFKNDGWVVNEFYKRGFGLELGWDFLRSLEMILNLFLIFCNICLCIGVSSIDCYKFNVIIFRK